LSSFAGETRGRTTDLGKCSGYAVLLAELSREVTSRSGPSALILNICLFSNRSLVDLPRFVPIAALLQAAEV